MATKSNSPKSKVGPQAPTALWSSHDAMRAVESGSVEDDVLILKKAGILQKDGTVSPRYKKWGKNDSRTPLAETTSS